MSKYWDIVSGTSCWVNGNSDWVNGKWRETYFL